MNWRRFRNGLVNQYHEQPQTTATIDHACRLVEEGLALLAQRGHLYHLADGPAPVSAEYPKVMFSITTPKGHLVLCAEDAEWLGDGWFDTLDEAKHADGMGTQFRRGGIIPRRGLPAIIAGGAESTRLDREKDHGY